MKLKNSQKSKRNWFWKYKTWQTHSSISFSSCFSWLSKYKRDNSDAAYVFCLLLEWLQHTLYRWWPLAFLCYLMRHGLQANDRVYCIECSETCLLDRLWFCYIRGCSNVPEDALKTKIYDQWLNAIFFTKISLFNFFLITSSTLCIT